MILVISLILQYLLVDNMFQTEQKNIKARSLLLLNDALALDLKQLGMERQFILNRDDINIDSELWGGNFDKKTITVSVAYPEQRIYKRECKTEKEWYEYSKEVYCRYHYTGVNLNRLDSAFKEILEEHSIMLPFVLMKIDSTNMVLEQMPSGIDYNDYKLSLDAIPLGIDGKDFLVARFDNSYYGMFRQMRAILITSFFIVALLTFITFFLLRTIFYQKKISEIREDFVRIIVHDLRNPIFYIGSILLDLKVGLSQQDEIDGAKRKIKRMSMMVDRLSETSSINKNLIADTAPVFVYEYVGEIINMYNTDMGSDRVNFLNESTSGKVDINLRGFENVMINLIDNAIKYSENNSEIFVRCYDENGYICTSVKDSGIGIPKKYLNLLFEKGFCVPEHKSLGKSGFGLGLNYVKKVVKAHDGKVIVKSEYKKGSEFIVMIPILK